MSDRSDQKISIEKSYSAFYTADNEFCYQRYGKQIRVNPTKIFTSTFKSMNATVEEHEKDGMTRDVVLGNHYSVLNAYFFCDTSEKYIAMLDESEWTFWFNHVNTQLRKVQTSPQWKQDGNLGRNDMLMIGVCYFFFEYSSEFKLLGKSSLQVLKEFFHALASCIDKLTSRLPHSDFIQVFTGICDTFEKTDSTTWKLLEKSGLLAHFLRCSTMPLDDMKFTYSFYTDLIRQFNFIEKEFKVGQPCGDVVRKILAGKEGHSNPDPKVLDFLQAILQLADETQPDEPKGIAFVMLM